MKDGLFAVAVITGVIVGFGVICGLIAQLFCVGAWLTGINCWAP